MPRTKEPIPIEKYIPRVGKWKIFTGDKRYHSIMPVPYLWSLPIKEIKLLKK